MFMIDIPETNGYSLSTPPLPELTNFLTTDFSFSYKQRINSVTLSSLAFY